MFSRLDRIPACDRQTDGQTNGQTSCDSIVHAMHARRAEKLILDVIMNPLEYTDHNPL